MKVYIGNCYEVFVNVLVQHKVPTKNENQGSKRTRKNWMECNVEWIANELKKLG